MTSPTAHLASRSITSLTLASLGFLASVAQLLDFALTDKGYTLTASASICLCVFGIAVGSDFRRKARTFNSPVPQKRYSVLVATAYVVATVAMILVLFDFVAQRSELSWAWMADAVVGIDAPVPGQVIEPAQNVEVAGTVSGLGDRKLWVLSKPDIGDGVYYLTQAGPVVEQDGAWRFTDIAVGDDSDRGHQITYYVVQADADCNAGLSRVQPRSEDGLRTIPILFEGCEIRAMRPVTVAR